MVGELLSARTHTLVTLECPEQESNLHAPEEQAGLSLAQNIPQLTACLRRRPSSGHSRGNCLRSQPERTRVRCRALAIPLATLLLSAAVRKTNSWAVPKTFVVRSAMRYRSGH